MNFKFTYGDGHKLRKPFNKADYSFEIIDTTAEFLYEEPLFICASPFETTACFCKEKGVYFYIENFANQEFLDGMEVRCENHKIISDNIVNDDILSRLFVADNAETLLRLIEIHKVLSE